ncbi:excitatory amino acid transporter 3-like [Notolabrus celidotus]|uniref:excitatory amino acid transporter 3-like n=1 Tax=Notolabrus celidotus TaxID=1203425 RepID=UPI001490391C|nr:excitatory amino acid transporter 3-like [Notolabrus celidotus]
MWLHLQECILFSSLMAALLGIVTGIAAKLYLDLSELETGLIVLLGGILERMIQMIIIPLIVSSVITGVSDLCDMYTVHRLNISLRIALRAAVYFFLTTISAMVTGIILAMLIKPGVTTEEVETDEGFIFFCWYALLDQLRIMFPENLIQASVQQYQTDKTEFEMHSDTTETNAHEEEQPGHYIGRLNSVGLIVCTFVFGVALKNMEEGKIVVQLLGIVNKVIEQMVALFMCYLPVGVLFMTVGHVLVVHDWQDIYKLGKFVTVVVLGLSIHGVIVLPTIYLLLARCNPWKVMKGVSPALRTAFILSSSSATLQLTLKSCEKRNHIDPKVSRFMLPIGARVNMDGTALYEVAAAVFIAQLSHIDLCLSQLIMIGIVVSVSSTGPAGIPAKGAMSTLFVLSAMGLPAKEVAGLVLVEWLLDRCNTVVNVLSDCIGVALVNQLSQMELEEKENQRRTRVSAGAVGGNIQDDELSSEGSGSYKTM